MVTVNLGVDRLGLEVGGFRSLFMVLVLEVSNLLINHDAAINPGRDSMLHKNCLAQLIGVVEAVTDGIEWLLVLTFQVTGGDGFIKILVEELKVRDQGSSLRGTGGLIRDLLEGSRMNAPGDSLDNGALCATNCLHVLRRQKDGVDFACFVALAEKHGILGECGPNARIGSLNTLKMHLVECACVVATLRTDFEVVNCRPRLFLGFGIV
mmetsp:Transcript_8783/g.20116  ORF Transcript_8783/g.20116 Transcript_8783/m.20116 type:complete len:209 (-) Transcript_8783:217-843(-)